MYSNRRLRAFLGIVAICMFASTILVAAFHMEPRHGECPVCQIANLPLIKPVEAVQLAPLQIVGRQVVVAELLHEREVVRVSGPPRAPPV